MLIGRFVNGISYVSPSLAGRVAFRLFFNARPRAALRVDERAVHAAAVTETITVDGTAVVTYRWGDGERPVLLLHGWQSRASRFAAFIPRLQALGYTPVGFDAPGHGDSGGRTTTIVGYRAVAEQLRQRYGTFEAVIGHSFGVLSAFLALRSGVLARRLIAVSGVSDFGYLVTTFVRQAGLNTRVERQVRRRIEGLFPAEGDLWNRFSGTHRPDEVGVPILVVHDDGDRVVEAGQATTIITGYGARARLHRTTGLGHHRILGDPDVIAAALAFLAEAPAPAGSPCVS